MKRCKTLQKLARCLSEGEKSAAVDVLKEGIKVLIRWELHHF